MYNIRRDAYLGEKTICVIYSEPMPQCPVLDNAVGYGSTMPAALDDFLKQLPAEFYVDRGEDWDDMHVLESRDNYEFDGDINVYEHNDVTIWKC